MPGVEYIRQIGGETVKPEYYNKLSRDKIVKKFLNAIVNEDERRIQPLSDIKFGNLSYYNEKVSTKANTLKSLKTMLDKSSIEELFIFTTAQWDEYRQNIIQSIIERFQDKIVVRSSSLFEDESDFSNAGFFSSLLDVDSKNIEDIQNAVQHVVKCYRDKDCYSPDNQILIQNQTQNVAVSGVVFTRDAVLNRPYYVINYDDSSAKTDSVTSGDESNKVEILRNVTLKDIPAKWRKLIEAVREIEDLLSGMVLDIEFAIKSDNEVVVFQVRPLTATRKFHFFDDEVIEKEVGLLQDAFVEHKRHKITLSKEVYYSDMAFWNPAEIIGDRPNYLEYSLYSRLLLQSAWNEGLLTLGYTAVNEELMVLFGSKPYINVHHAFLTLIPSGLSQKMKAKLVNYYNSKLKSNPGWHDKIEFKIVHSCYDFMLDAFYDDLEEHGFTNDEIEKLFRSLLDLTNGILKNFNKILEDDIRGIEKLSAKREVLFAELNDELDWIGALEVANALLKDCRLYGVRQFSRVARLAFIGKRIIESLNERGVIKDDEYERLFSSVSTVATELDNAFEELRCGNLGLSDFLNRYGHLRPGTYDINKLTYIENPEYFEKGRERADLESVQECKDVKGQGDFELLPETKEKINMLCETFNIAFNADYLVKFSVTSIKLRELFKFEFTKNLSKALDLLVFAGKELGFSRDDVSQLDYNSVLNTFKFVTKDELVNIWRSLVAGRREEKRINNLIALPSILFARDDFIAVKQYQSLPNYITDLVVIESVVAIEIEDSDINGKIVVLEKADPGYDWIFTHKIAGLITKYGGAASHMAIRCAEFIVPAAIGCGENIFEKVIKSRKIMLDCKNRRIESL